MNRPSAEPLHPVARDLTPREGGLASYPPVERWDDWQEFDPGAWPKKVPRRYELIPTICFNCEAACGLLAYVDKETLKIQKFEGNPVHPGSRGRNCAKGPATLNQVQDPERILYPMRRQGPRGAGQWQRVTWDDALDDIAGRIRQALVERRPKEIMYHLGRPGHELVYLQRVFHAWGIDGHNSHTNVCSSSARAGYAFWHGMDRPSPDHANARFILLLSSHLETGHYFNPHAQRIIEAKMRGAKVAVIDSRLSNTASMADYWLSPWPGTEAAILLAMARLLVSERRCDRAFVEKWTNWDEYLREERPDLPVTFDSFHTALEELYAPYTPEFAAEESGVPAATIVEIARAIGAAGGADRARDLDDRRRRHAALLRRELRRVGRVQLLERGVEAVEGHRQIGPLLAQVLVPVRPLLDERAVVAPLAHEQARHGEQEGCLRPGPRREPVVGHRGGVGQARVDDGDLRAAHLGLDDPLRVRVEVVAGLEVRGQQQDEAGVGVIRRGPVHAVPEGVAGARAGRADVGVAVVTVDPPRVKHALQVDELVPGPAQVIHDFLGPTLDEGLPNAAGDIVERVVPGHALPLPGTPGALAAHRVEDALGILDLIQGGRALGAVATAAARMHGVALELLDLQRLLVDVREQAAGGLAVEADGRDQLVASRNFLRPRDGIELLPVVPALDGRIGGQPALARCEVARHRMQRLRARPVHRPPRVEF